MVTIILTIVALAIVGGAIFGFYKWRSNERASVRLEERFTIDMLGDYVVEQLTERVRDDASIIKSDLDYDAKIRTKDMISKALDNCIHGVTADKNFVISMIYDILGAYLPTTEDILQVYPFDSHYLLDPNTVWIMVYYYLNKQTGGRVFTWLEQNYHLSEKKMVINPVNGTMMESREFDQNLLRRVANQVIPDEISYPDMLDILTYIVYCNRYGFGIVDCLRAADIDGFNFGTSGSVRYRIEGERDVPYKTSNSVWIQINAAWIHLSFLEFKSDGEMKRIINQLVAWGNAAPMTEIKPYKVNDGYDGARVTALRPPVGESWACFVRKFSAGLYSKEKLLNKPTVHNWELPAKLMYFLMRGEQTTAFTGQQNTGKTSMMKAAMADVDLVNIRILEMSFELAIRELYPWKNVITVKPSDYVKSSELQDLLKKTDGYLSMVGEVAEDIVASRMIQFCLIASAFTLFSHHAKTDEDLVNGLANSLVACGEYENHDVAISTVLSAIKNNVHLDFVKGERVIAYISEIRKLNELEPYQDLKISPDVKAAVDQLCSLQKEYYTRTTDRVRFESRKIIVFDPETMSYRANDGYSPEALANILQHMRNPKMRVEFMEFYKANWPHLFKA